MGKNCSREMEIQTGNGDVGGAHCIRPLTGVHRRISEIDGNLSEGARAFGRATRLARLRGSRLIGSSPSTVFSVTRSVLVKRCCPRRGIFALTRRASTTLVRKEGVVSCWNLTRTSNSLASSIVDLGRYWGWPWIGLSLPYPGDSRKMFAGFRLHMASNRPVLTAEKAKAASPGGETNGGRCRPPTEVVYKAHCPLDDLRLRDYVHWRCHSQDVRLRTPQAPQFDRGSRFVPLARGQQ
mmetsp:Transcript_47174/g.115596  ORF Transcript_47174/g.115596 Transcript_47174/m.115596 type:complete len:238 (-) Transcript_47174:149-862(-)